MSDDFMGYCEFTITTQDDFDFDAWVDLVPRPGKKDKKVKGQIHLQWNVRFMKNFVVNPATEWPDLSLISIEPVPYLNYIEVMGPIHDFVMLTCLSDCKIRRLPTKMFSKRHQRESLGWEIKVCTPGPLLHDRRYKNKWKADYVQNICLKLLNRFANYGFMLLHGDMLHGFAEYDRTLWMVRSRTSANVINQSTYLMVEPWFFGGSKIRVEVQGDMDPRILAMLINDFDYIQLCDPYKEHMMFSLYSKNYKGTSWSGSNVWRMKENASQNLVLAVMDALSANGFVHATVWGGAQIMVRSNEWAASGTAAVTGRVGKFAIVDPFWIVGATPRIEIQGMVDDNFITQVALALETGRQAKLELKKQFDKKGAISSYQFKSKEIDSSAMTLEGARKNENIFQNLTLDVVSKLGMLGGYEFVSTFGSDCLMLQRTIVPSHLPPNSRFKYLLLDPCVNTMPLRFEIQGDITLEQAATASASCGCDKVREEASSRFGHTAWVIPVAGTSNESFTLADVRRKMNKLQFYALRLLSYFHNYLGYEAVTQWQNDAFLCRIRSPTELMQGQYIMVDTIMLGTARIEVTGDISLDEVNAAAMAAGIPLAKPMVDRKDKNIVMGYVIETDYRSVNAASLEERRIAANLWQFVWIKFFNKLSSFGWQYKFPFNHGFDRGSVFFRPLRQ